MKLALVTTASVLALAAGTANATLFSFASDTDDVSYTFRGAGLNITDANDPNDSLDLLIDDDNGPAGPVTFDQVDFRANFTLANYQSVNLGGGRFLHTYDIVGAQGGAATFEFVNPDGSVLLTCTFNGGVFSSLGSANAWGSTAGINANDDVGGVTYTWNGPALPAYDLFPGTSINPDDAAFTLTNLRTILDGGAFRQGVQLNNGTPTGIWTSEGSFSGTAVIPAPGALALLGLGSAAVLRRRR